MLFGENELSLDEVAFDEMNIVELPFALLTRNTKGIYEIPLSADGSSNLACLNSKKYGLPNSLAPRVLLGLMWLWKSEYSEKDRAFTFSIRRLVERYMYPKRKHAPNGELLQSVERQVNCIANSRIHTDKWFDKHLNRTKDANIVILTDVTVEDEGGPHRPRIIKTEWGYEFWLSMVNKYTKTIDARIVQSLNSPLDLQLYRLLHRQLANKRSQKYKDIVAFARFKLGMHGKTLDAGGRTAATYVAKKILASVESLSHDQFTVRAEVEASRLPFSITFTRIDDPRRPNRPHEVINRDLPAELIREFEFHAHGIPREKKRTRIKGAYREAAQTWLDSYGFEKACWMTRHAVKSQKEGSKPPIKVFTGLQLYEAEAHGAYERHLERQAGQQRLSFERECDAMWSRYQNSLLKSFDANTTPDILKEIHDEAFQEAQKDCKTAPKPLLKTLATSLTKTIKLTRMRSLSQGEFREQLERHQGLSESFKAALTERHGFDPFSQPALSS